MLPPITIGISFSETNYANYPAWIMGENTGIEIIELSCKKENSGDLSKCQGLLLTGGIDIAPVFYNSERSGYPNKPATWNKERDQFEIDLFHAAQVMGMPVLGVCRGLQLVNVALGGNLVQDIEEAGKQNHRSQDAADQVHTIQIQQGSLLSDISGISQGMVNSAHHQALGHVAETLLVNCFSPDGIAEGMEWKEKNNHPPLLCVQWHPERIQDKHTNPLSKNIRDWFLLEAAKHQL